MKTIVDQILNFQKTSLAEKTTESYDNIINHEYDLFISTKCVYILPTCILLWRNMDGCIVEKKNVRSQMYFI